MLVMLRKDVIEETLDAQIAKRFDTDAASKRLSKRLLTSSSFMAPITTFVRRKLNTTMEYMEFSVTFASTALVDTVEPFNDENESLSSRPESFNEERARWKSYNSCSKNLHNQRKIKDVNSTHQHLRRQMRSTTCLKIGVGRKRVFETQAT